MTGPPGSSGTPGAAYRTEEGDRGGLPSPTGAVGLLLLVAFLYLVGGLPLQLLLGEPGLLFSQLLFLALPVILVVRWRGYDPVATLSLRIPSVRHLGAGLLVLAGGLPVAWFLAWLQSFFVPVPVEYLEAMAEVLTADSVPRLLWLLVLVAAVPALSEELVFRGLLLSGFRTRMPAVAAAIATGLVFGLFHLSPQTGFRILPTAWLGFVFAWVVLTSGSLPLAMLLHFVNNGALLVLAALPPTQELVAGTEGAPPFALLPLALVLLWWGLRLLGPARRSRLPLRRRGPDGIV